MTFKRRVLAAGEIHFTCFFIDGFELINHPLTFGQLTHQCTVAVKQIQVFKTIALRGPDKLFALVDKGKVVMQVHPGVGRLGKYHILGIGFHINAAQFQCLLCAVLPLIGKVFTVWHPLAARQINVFVLTQVNPVALLGFQVLNSQAYFDIGRTSRGVLLLNHLDFIGVDFRTGNDVYRRFIYFRKGDVLLVR